MYKKLFILVSFLLLSFHAMADKLDLLTDNWVAIGTSRDSLKNGDVYQLKMKGDSVLVDEIVLATKNNTKKNFSIEESETKKNLIQIQASNSLSRKELADNDRIFLYEGHQYIVQWGEKTWKMNLTKAGAEKATIDSAKVYKAQVDSSNQVGANIEGKHESQAMDWVMYIVLFLVGCLGGAFIEKKGHFIEKKGHFIERIVTKIKKKEPTQNKGDVSSESKSSVLVENDEQSGTDCIKEENGSLVEHPLLSDSENQMMETIYMDILKCLQSISTLSDYYSNQLINFSTGTPQQKLSALKEILTDLLKEKDINKQHVSRINELKNQLQSSTSLDTVAKEDTVSVSELERLIKDKDFFAKRYVDVKKENEGATFQDNFKRWMSIEASSHSKPQPLVSFEEQLKQTANRGVLKQFFKDNYLVEFKQFFDKSMSSMTFDTCLGELKSKLKLLDNTTKKTDEEIILAAVESNALSEAVQKMLLQDWVKEINEHIKDEQHKISASKSRKEVVVALAENLEKELPQDVTVAADNERMHCLEALGDVLGQKLMTLDQGEMKKALDQYVLSLLVAQMKDLSNATSLNQVYDEIRSAMKDTADLDSYLARYKVGKLGEVEKAILDEETKRINRLLPNLLDDNAEFLSELAKCSSSEQIVNKICRTLTGKLKTITEDNEKVGNVLADHYQNVTGKEFGSKADVLKCANEYVHVVSDEIQRQQESIKNLQNEKNLQLEKINILVREQDKIQTSLDQKESLLKALSQNYVQTFERKLEKLSEVVGLPFLSSCTGSDEDENSCINIEDKLINATNEFIEQAKKSDYAQQETPQLVYQRIQTILKEELNQENSAFGVIARYYAYSRLAFMTDDSRKYGFKLNRKTMAQKYAVLNELLVDFGIVLSLPSLFVETLRDGEYEDYTGKAYSDLDNLCPNARNHKDKIDNANKDKIAIDIVQVGYSVNGELQQKTKVLI